MGRKLRRALPMFNFEHKFENLDTNVLDVGPPCPPRGGHAGRGARDRDASRAAAPGGDGAGPGRRGHRRRDRPGSLDGAGARPGRLGGVHYLVNNAGVTHDGALWRLTPEAWQEVLDTNVTGAFNCIQAVAGPMRAQRYGKIVNVASHQAFRPGFGIANYAASKAG